MRRTAALLMCAALSVLAQTKAINDWRVVPGVRVGPITATTTRADLARLFGEGNLEDGPVEVGEGFEEPATIVYSTDPSRALAVFWRGEGTGRLARSVDMCGMSSKPCRWRTAEGISMGTDLKTLEKYNRRPFKMAGFGWDYSGTVTSWEGGRLDAPRGRLLVRLEPRKGSSVDDDLDGDRDFISSHAPLQRLNPVVYAFIVEFGR